MKIYLIPCILSASFSASLAFQAQSRWQPIQTPVSSNIHYAKLFNQNLGYVFSEEAGLFKYKNGHWSRIALPAEGITAKVCVVAEDEIWAIVQPLNAYRQVLYKFQDGAWRSFRMKNAESFRKLVFENPEEGWAIGDWGEIHRYKNDSWEHFRSPTRCHIIDMFKTADHKLYALTDCQFDTSDMLEWDGNRWNVVRQLPGEEFNFLHIFNDNSIWLRTREGVFALKEDTLTKIDLEPLPPVWKIAFFPDNSGYFRLNDLLFYFTSLPEKDIQPTTFEHAGLIARIALAPDYSGWLCGGSGQIWVLGAADNISAKNTSNLPFYTTSQDYAQPTGSAALKMADGSVSLYTILHDLPNVMTPNIDSQGLKSGDQLPSPGVPEPQRTVTGDHLYDQSVLIADFNGDAAEDIFLTSLFGQNILLLNSGNDAFHDVSEWAGFSHHRTARYCIAATADIDNDGDLDLFVPNEKGQSSLFLNDGFARFSDKSMEWNVNVSYAAKAGAFGDIDNDGFIDLAVTAYQAGTRMFRNTGNGRFEEITEKSPALLIDPLAKNSSLTFSDFDSDGDLDLFICKLLYSNRLLQNDGRGRFVDVTQKAGLLDSSESRGAWFFDVENDGDLDLFITNEGNDDFYRGNDKATFAKASSELSLRTSTWLPSSFIANTFGALSSGAIVFDEGRDGLLDLFVGHFDHLSVLYRNRRSGRPGEPRRKADDFLQLTLNGLRANASSVGARVSLYPAGKLGEKGALLGTRVIESVSGYGSHSEKLIHFGVKTGAAYDAEIVFPGGETLIRKKLQAGKRYHIDELSGRDADWPRLQKRAANAFWGFRGGLRTILLLILLILTFALYLTGRRLAGWRTMEIALAWAFLWGIAIRIHQTAFFKTESEFLLVPLFFGLAGAVSASWGWRQLTARRRRKNNDFETLAFKLKAFDHSEYFMNILSSLAFHLENFQPQTAPPPLILQKFQKDVGRTKQDVHPEIQSIISTASHLRFDKNQIQKLHDQWKRLLKSLSRAQTRFRRDLGLSEKQIREVQSALAGIRELLKSLKTAVSEKETTNLGAFFEKLFADYAGNGMTFEISANDVKSDASIPVYALKKIIDELIANAARAMANKSRKNISIAVKETDRISIDFTDTGRGIAPTLGKTVFQRSSSSRTGGGFGLFMVKETLEAYGGGIAISESSGLSGAAFRILLNKNDRTPDTVA